MRIPYFQIDAFTRQPFRGNPAGVCVLTKWIPDSVLQAIAAENNLAETAFLVAEGGAYRLRWFTPESEVDLCGHATLATAFVLFTELGFRRDTIEFNTRSGRLTATRREGIIELDFPARPPAPCPAPAALIGGLGRTPREVLRARDYFAVFDTEAEVAALAPDMNLLRQLDSLGTIVTARGTDADFVSRFFAPSVGLPEDPVTGSAHCSLIPFWAERLGKPDLFARQISRRGGELFCRLKGERVGIGGHAVAYARGELAIADPG